MTEIRAKDKLFVAVALPVALAAFYWFGVRGDLSAKATALDREVAGLVTAEDFDFELSRAKRAVAEAERELAAEKAKPPPEVKVRAEAQAPEAVREAALLAVFRAAGLSVVSSAPAAEERVSRFSDVLRATGVCPQPVRRTYELQGRYPQMIAALETIETRQMAVLVVRLSTPVRGLWTLEVML